MIGIFLFIISANICYNLVWIITHNIQLVWNFNIFQTLTFLFDLRLLFGTILLFILLYLFVLKYSQNIKLNFFQKKGLPEEDGSLEYGSSRFMKEREIKKNFKTFEFYFYF